MGLKVKSAGYRATKRQERIDAAQRDPRWPVFWAGFQYGRYFPADPMFPDSQLDIATKHFTTICRPTKKEQGR